MEDLSDHPFSPENIARENGLPNDLELSWLRYVKEVERLLGHDVDGNDPDFEHGVGYSLDECYRYWDARKSPHGYVMTVFGRDRYDRGASVAADPINTIVDAVKEGLDPALAASIAAGILRAGK